MASLSSRWSYELFLDALWPGAIRQIRFEQRQFGSMGRPEVWPSAPLGGRAAAGGLGTCFKCAKPLNCTGIGPSRGIPGLSSLLQAGSGAGAYRTLCTACTARSASNPSWLTTRTWEAPPRAEGLPSQPQEASHRASSPRLRRSLAPACGSAAWSPAPCTRERRSAGDIEVRSELLMVGRGPRRPAGLRRRAWISVCGTARTGAWANRCRR